MAVIDDYRSKCLALMADTSLSSARAVPGQNAVIDWRDRPAAMVFDNETKITSMADLR